MTLIRPTVFLLLMSLLLTACGSRDDEGPVVVSAIGEPVGIVDPNRVPVDASHRTLLSAVAEGLVAFDAAGQIEPALAQRWIVTDDGLSYIFRLKHAEWSDGKRVTANDVARRLRAVLANSSRNPLKNAFEAIDEIVVITPEVLEIRLTTPRPPLLALLAQPEMAMLSGEKGAGAFRIESTRNGAMLLVPKSPPDAEEGEGEEIPEEHTVLLRGERAALAIARFTAGGADLVLGGDIVTLAVARAAEPRQRELRFDYPMGLFGLTIVENHGFLADPENRRALAMALDRDALVAALGVPNWSASIAILPERYRSAADPALPAWTGLDRGARLETARAVVTRWRASESGGDAAPPLRIALPDAPGSRVIFARIAADWRRIGVAVERVAYDADADLRLMDSVAPADSAIWYLSTLACPVESACAEGVSNALTAARTAPALAERGIHLAIADRLITDDARYIPIARPIRWSLVAQRLNEFRENPRALHSLHHLRRENR